MRLSILSLLLSFGVAAICQTAAPGAGHPPQRFLTPPILTPPAIAEPGRDFTKLPPDWNFAGVVPRKTIIVREAELPRLQGDAEIDPKMIVRPPQSSLGEQPPGTMIAQNLYPGLSMLPIEESKLRAEPLSTTWPNLKVQPIPITWQKFEIKPVESGAKRETAGR